MNKHQEKLLIATLAGLIIAAAATFAVIPANAASDNVRSELQVIDVHW